MPWRTTEYRLRPDDAAGLNSFSNQVTRNITDRDHRRNSPREWSCAPRQLLHSGVAVSFENRRHRASGERTGLAASLETGYPFDLGDGWILEPQAQLIYQNIRFDDLNDGAATVRFDDLNSLTGRIGARVARTWRLTPMTKRQLPHRHVWQPSGDG